LRKQCATPLSVGYHKENLRRRSLSFVFLSKLLGTFPVFVGNEYMHVILIYTAFTNLTRTYSITETHGPVRCTLQNRKYIAQSRSVGEPKSSVLSTSAVNILAFRIAGDATYTSIMHYYPRNDPETRDQNRTFIAQCSGQFYGQKRAA